MNSATRQALLGVLLTSTAALCALTPSLSQAQPTGADVSEVVVTGSHLRRASAEGPSPVVSISGEAVRASGYLSLGDVLSDLPVVAGAANQQTGSITSFLTGQVRLDVRGLGPSRTLVLQDGRRVPFSDASSPAVDMNIFPSLMVERVDIVPGGASAVYGSEAVAGVVNVIMKRSIEGIEADVRGGISQEGDGEEMRLGLAWGHKSADGRLNLVVGGELTHSALIMQRDRDNLYPGLRRNSSVLPQTSITNSKTTQSPYATFQLRPTVAVAIDAQNPGQLAVLSAACTPTTVLPTCQDPSLIYNTFFTPLQGRTDRGVFRAHADYDVTDRMKAFGEVNYARIEGYAPNTPAFSATSGATPAIPISIGLDNAFLLGPGALAQQLRAAVAAAAVPAGSRINIGKYFGEFGGRDSKTKRDASRFTGGLEGDFTALAHEVHWDAYAQYGRTQGTVVSPGVPNVVRLQQAVDSILVNGVPTCRAAAAQAAGCVPFDIVNGASPTAIAWANGVSIAKQDVRQTVAAANLSTDLFELPAGPLSLAAGLEYRKEESRFSQDPITASGVLFATATGTRAGQYDVAEGYVEARVPVLKDLPFAHELSVEGAYRAANYSSVGPTDQYRLAMVWAPVRDITFRASQGTAVRAPNIVELYAPQTTSFTVAAFDPCDRAIFAGATAAQQAARRVTCAAAIASYNPATFQSNVQPGRTPGLRVITGGNPALGPETAKTYQLGVVIKPRFAPDLRLSVDAFRYNIRGGVSSVPLASLIALCYDATSSYGSNPFCALIARDAAGTSTGVAGGVLNVQTTLQNLASTKVEGYDASASYVLRTADRFGRDYGDLALRVDATRLYRYILQGLPGQAYLQQANTVQAGLPEWKGQGSVDWTLGRWSAGWTTRFIGSMILSTSVTPAQFQPFSTGDYWMHDARIGYRLNDVTLLRAGVQNLSDKYPPQLPETYNGASSNGAGVYDNRGRYFYVGASLTY